MRAAELLMMALGLLVAIAAVVASGWGVLLWTSMLAAPYFMLVLASRQLEWWAQARGVVVGVGLVASIVVASVQLRAMGLADEDAAIAAGRGVMLAWVAHAVLALVMMIAAAVLTIRRVRELRRGR